MSAQDKFTAEQVIAAIRDTKGLVSLAARKLGCKPDTVRSYAKRYATVGDALREEREAMTDVAELALYGAIQNKEAWAVCFYLKTQGKGRGYVERQEVDHRGAVGVASLTADDLAQLRQDAARELAAEGGDA